MRRQGATRGKVARGEASASADDGIFHQLPEKMRQSLLTTCMEDVQATRVADRSALDAQRAAKRREEELAREAVMAKGQEAYIDALYYREMFDSDACWRTAAAVDRQRASLKAKTAELDALKENIRMRVLGLGWSEFHTPWSKDGKVFTADHLAAHLKTIILAASSRDPCQAAAPSAEAEAAAVAGRATRHGASTD